MSDKHECNCGADVAGGQAVCPLWGQIMGKRAWEICSGKPHASRPVPPMYRLRKLSKWYRRILDREPPEIVVQQQLARKRLCVHLGEQTGEMEDCKSCGNDGKVKTRFKVFACRVPEIGKTTIPECVFCPHYKARVPDAPKPCEPLEPPGPEQCLGCAYAYLSLPPERLDHKEWSAWPNVQEAHKLGVERFAGTVGEYPEHCAGRGVVMAAGGVKYFVNAWVATNILRHVGCTLPVEWWYLGDGEMDRTMLQLAGELGVKCVNAFDVAAKLDRWPRILSGWELKPFAMLHSEFREVLFLDADNVPTRDPSFLFEHDEYRYFGSVFWPDLAPPGNREEWIPPGAWEAVGLAYQDVRAFESGQALVDKARCWKELSLTVWLNEHSDRYYQVVYGDKDTFLLAWQVFGTQYGMTRFPAGPRSYGIAQLDFDGNILFQHRCQAKWQLRGRNRRVGDFIHGAECLRAIRDLRDRWHGRLWAYSDQTPEELVVAELLPGRYMYDRAGLGSRELELLLGGAIGIGKADCEQGWSVRITDAHPELLITGSGNLTMRLRTAGVHTWYGRWERHERCGVTLSRMLPYREAERLAG